MCSVTLRCRRKPLLWTIQRIIYKGHGLNIQEVKKRKIASLHRDFTEMETAAEHLQVSCFHHLAEAAGVAWLTSRGSLGLPTSSKNWLGKLRRPAVAPDWASFSRMGLLTLANPLPPSRSQGRGAFHVPGLLVTSGSLCHRTRGPGWPQLRSLEETREGLFASRVYSQETQQNVTIYQYNVYFRPLPGDKQMSETCFCIPQPPRIVN